MDFERICGKSSALGVELKCGEEMIDEMCRLFKRLPHGPMRYLPNLGSKPMDTTLPTAAASALSINAGGNADGHAQP